MILSTDYRTASSSFLRAAPAKASIAESSVPNKLIDLKKRNIRNASNDIAEILNQELEGNGGRPISYQYIPEQDKLLIVYSLSPDSTFNTVFKSSINEAPGVQVFNHIHHRSLKTSHEEITAPINEGAQLMIDAIRRTFKDEPVVLDKFNSRLKNLKGTMHMAYDGAYNKYILEGTSNPYETEAKLREQGRIQELEEHMREQGRFVTNFDFVANFSDGDYNQGTIGRDKFFDYSEADQCFRVKSMKSYFERMQGAVEIIPSFLAHEFGHMINLNLSEEAKNSLFLLRNKHSASLVPGLSTDKVKAIQGSLATFPDIDYESLPELNQDMSSLTVSYNDPGEVRVTKAIERLRLIALEALKARNIERFKLARDRCVGFMVDISLIKLVSTDHSQENLRRFAPADWLDLDADPKTSIESDKTNPNLKMLIKNLLIEEDLGEIEALVGAQL